MEIITRTMTSRMARRAGPLSPLAVDGTRRVPRVYASPSRRQMDTKGDGEEITYPHICFMVDNFDEVFCDIVVRDGEMVCVELVARGRGAEAGAEGAAQAVIFLGSIRYDALTRVYDSRQTSLSTKVAQRMSFGLLGGRGAAAARCEFVRMRGPGGKGHAEVAVARPRGAGVATPTSEPGHSADYWDSDCEDDVEDMFVYRHQRRLSDPSANIDTWARGGWRTRDGQRARSESDGLDSLAGAAAEIEAGDLRDELDDGASNPLWAMRGFTQTFHLWKEGRRAQCAPLHAYLTYVTLPWWAIAKDILDLREEPILTF